VAENRPNIVFFMTDQLSAKWLEGQSRKACPTPHIDRLRERGISFRQAITSNPLCMPARATIATGLTTRGHGVLQNGYELDPALPNFMQLLRSAGWRTGAFGKLHFTSHFHGVHPDCKPYGFDIVRNTEDPRAGEWLDWIEGLYPELYEAALATIWATAIPELKEYGKNKVDLSTRVGEIRKKLKWATDQFPENTPGYHTLLLPEHASQTAWITRHALDFIDKFDPKQPICAFISYVQPHSPFCPPERVMDRIDPREIPEPIPPEWVNEPRPPDCFAASEGARREIPDNWRIYRHYYLADITHLDDQLGQVVGALQETGRWEDTYLIFLSDHGELLLDHGFSGKGERHYDACVRVPLIITGPGVEQGATCDALVQLEDICPTVLDMAGVAYPEPPVMGPYHRGEAEALPGRSLLPWCRGARPGDWRDAAYIESYNNIRGSELMDWARTVRTSEWRYTLYPAGTGEQLFHLRNDPDETRNLASDPRHAHVRQRLRDRLLELIILQDYPHTPRERFALGVH
jgi:arylsulfatase A-like enzyme